MKKLGPDPSTHIILNTQNQSMNENNKSDCNNKETSKSLIIFLAEKSKIKPVGMA